MPRYRNGLIAAGINAAVSRAGVVVAHGGGTCWLDHRVLYQRKVGEPDLQALKAHDGVTEFAIDRGGAHVLAAGGEGTWAAFTTSRGVRSNRHPDLPMAGLRDVGPEGTLAYCRQWTSADPRSDGTGLILRALDGTNTELVSQAIAHACRDVQVLGPSDAVWTQGSRLKSTLPGLVTVDGGCGSGRTVVLHGERFVAYWHQDAAGERLVLQPWSDPTRGWVLTQPGQVRDGQPDWPAYRPDLIAHDGALRACWSVTEAEGPASIRERTIALTDARVDLNTRPAAPLAPFAHPTAVTWFFEDSARPTVSPGRAPGNWSLIVEPGLRPTKPVVLSVPADRGADLIAEWASRWAQVRGIYVAHESDKRALRELALLALTRMRARNLPLRPIYSYSAGHVWTDIPEIDVIGVQCYPEPGESTAASEHRFRNLLQPAAGKRVWLVCGVCDRRPLSGITEDVLLPLVDVYHRLAAETHAEIGLFAYGRQGGAREFPRLLRRLDDLARCVVRLRAIEEDDVNKPGVEILDWKPIDGDKTGRLVRFIDRNNQQFGTIEVTLEHGSLHVSISNDHGKDRTSQTRQVI